MQYRWEAPAYQEVYARSKKKTAAQQSGCSLGLVAACADAPARLLVVAARHAFFHWPAVGLRRLCTHLGVALPHSPGLCDLLCALIQNILKVTAAEALDIIGQRCAIAESDESDHDGLLQNEEVTEMLDKDDAKEVPEQLVREAKDKMSRQALSREVASRQAVLPINARTSRYKQAKKALQTHRYLVQAPRGGAISQDEAQSLCPPNCRILLDDFNARWRITCPNLHCPPMSRSWGVHGWEESLNLVLKYAWTNYLRHEGLPNSLCAFATEWGWPDAAQPAASVGTAASSSSGR